MNADGLENLTLVKNDYKGINYPRIPTVVKEPDPETISPAPVKKAAYTSIFMSFISTFLDPELKPNKKRMIGRMSHLINSEQVTPVPLTLTEGSESNRKGLQTSKSPQPVLPELTKSSLSFSLASTLKLPEIKNAKSSRNLNSTNYIFSGLKPSNTLSSFLKIEEERIMESRNKRIAKLQIARDSLPNLEGGKKRKKRNKTKKSKKVKKVKSLPRIISPYQLIQTIK
jgi:hypothetical protein